MVKKASNLDEKVGKIKINTLEDLIRLNLDTLEDVVSESIDNRKAALIFTGSRTVASSFKLGLEAVKLGIRQVSGMGLGATSKLLQPKKDADSH